VAKMAGRKIQNPESESESESIDMIFGYFNFRNQQIDRSTDSAFLCPRTNCRCVDLLIVCPQFPNIISVLLQLSFRRRFIGENRVNQINILNVAGEST